MEFIAKSLASEKIKKVAFMAKEIGLNVYIYGEKGVGKTFLAHYIAPDALIYTPGVKTHNTPVIIENFDTLKSFEFNFERIIATGTTPLTPSLKEKFFTVDIELKPLIEREEEIEAFAEHFLKEAREILKIDSDIKEIRYDISENLNSLKKSIFKQLLLSSFGREDVIMMLKLFFDVHYDENSSYDEALLLFDKALIEVLLKKYKSKLQVSKQLKINRATLTKKVKAIEE